MGSDFVEFFDLKDSLLKADDMAVKSNNKNTSLENAYYTKLALIIMEMIEATAESGGRSVNVCLVEDNTVEKCMKISVKNLKKAYEYYRKHSVVYNKYYDNLNCQERTIYQVLRELKDKGYYINLFYSRRYDGDEYFEVCYNVPYVTIVW